jgi:hypothetical protein
MIYKGPMTMTIIIIDTANYLAMKPIAFYCKVMEVILIFPPAHAPPPLLNSVVMYE